MPTPDETAATEPLELFSHTAPDDFRLLSVGPRPTGAVFPCPGSVTEIDGEDTPIDRRHQQDAVRLEFAGRIRHSLPERPDGEPVDLKRYLNSRGRRSLRWCRYGPSKPIRIAMRRVWPCAGEVDLAGYIPNVVDGSGWATVSIPLKDLESRVWIWQR